MTDKVQPSKFVSPESPFPAIASGSSDSSVLLMHRRYQRKDCHVKLLNKQHLRVRCEIDVDDHKVISCQVVYPPNYLASLDEIAKSEVSLCFYNGLMSDIATLVMSEEEDNLTVASIVDKFNDETVPKLTALLNDKDARLQKHMAASQSKIDEMIKNHETVIEGYRSEIEELKDERQTMRTALAARQLVLNHESKILSAVWPDCCGRNVCISSVENLLSFVDFISSHDSLLEELAQNPKQPLKISANAGVSKMAVSSWAALEREEQKQILAQFRLIEDVIDVDYALCAQRVKEIGTAIAHPKIAGGEVDFVQQYEKLIQETKNKVQTGKEVQNPELELVYEDLKTIEERTHQALQVLQAH